MRHHTTGPKYRLNGPEGPSVAITPTTTAQRATFNFHTPPAKLSDGLALYLEAIYALVKITVDQPASGGEVVNPDDLYRMISSVRVHLPSVGNVYSHTDLTGPILGNVVAPIALGGRYPFLLRPQIASTDGDTECTIPLLIPFAHYGFSRGHHMAPPLALFNNAQLEVDIAPSTAIAAVSTGAVSKTCTVEACLFTLPEPEVRLPSLSIWRTNTTPGGQSVHEIPNIGTASGLKHYLHSCGLAGLYWLSNLKGLPGADTVEKITALEIPSRGQEGTDQPWAFFVDFLERMGIRDTRVGAQWPYAIGTTAPTAPNASTALFFPLIGGGDGQEVQKLQHWNGGDVFRVKPTYSSTPSGAATWLSHELYELDESGALALMRELQLPQSRYRLAGRKASTGSGQGRYAPWLVLER